MIDLGLLQGHTHRDHHLDVPLLTTPSSCCPDWHQWCQVGYNNQYGRDLSGYFNMNRADYELYVAHILLLLGSC